MDIVVYLIRRDTGLEYHGAEDRGRSIANGWKFGIDEEKVEDADLGWIVNKVLYASRIIQETYMPAKGQMSKIKEGKDSSKELPYHTRACQTKLLRKPRCQRIEGRRHCRGPKPMPNAN